jgi:hypothetical protein
MWRAGCCRCGRPTALIKYTSIERENHTYRIIVLPANAVPHHHRFHSLTFMMLSKEFRASLDVELLFLIPSRLTAGDAKWVILHHLLYQVRCWPKNSTQTEKHQITASIYHDDQGLNTRLRLYVGEEYVMVWNRIRETVRFVIVFATVCITAIGLH